MANHSEIADGHNVDKYLSSRGVVYGPSRTLYAADQLGFDYDCHAQHFFWVIPR